MGYTVYVWTGEYVLRDFKSWGRELYLFPSCRVAVDVKRNQVSRPYVLDAYVHPFLPSKQAVPKQGICTGFTTVKAKERAERIIKRIELGLNVLLFGYHADCHPFHELSMHMFNKFRITPDHPKLKSGEVRITNEWSERWFRIHGREW